MQERKLKRSQRSRLSGSAGSGATYGSGKLEWLKRRGKRALINGFKGIGVYKATKILEEIGQSVKAPIVSKRRAEALSQKLGVLRKIASVAFKPHPRSLDSISGGSAFGSPAIDQLIKLNTYRGSRHLKGFPVRGQRTRSNAKTVARMLSKIRPLSVASGKGSIGSARGFAKTTSKKISGTKTGTTVKSSSTKRK